MNLPFGLWSGLGVDYIFAFLSVGWTTFLHSGLLGWIWGGLHFCILVCGVDYILHSGLWGGFGVDYICAFWSIGWIWGGWYNQSGLMEFIVIFCRINVNDQGPEKWTDLYAILAGEGRHFSEVEVDGHCLLQALEEAFWRDYDIPYPIPKIIHVAHELVTNTKYTRYYTHQLDQNEVSKQFSKNMRRKHGKMLTELYIPAIANACNIQVNIISNIFRFVSSFNTIPEELTPATKVINLLWKDEKYSAAVRALDGALPIPGECPHPFTSIAILPASEPVVVKDEPTGEPHSIPETQISQRNEVTTIPETQIMSLNKDSSNMPEKEIVTIKEEPTSPSNKTKANQTVTEVIVITDSSDDSDDTVEELKSY